MEERFKDYPKALAATAEIAERCKFDLPIGGSLLPTVPCSNLSYLIFNLHSELVLG